MSEQVEAVAKEEISEENLQSAEQQGTVQESVEQPVAEQAAEQPDAPVAESAASAADESATEPVTESVTESVTEAVASTEATATPEAASTGVANTEAANTEAANMEAPATEWANGEDAADPASAEETSTTPAAESENASDSGDAESDDSQDEKKVVRVLAVGQQVPGTVKRISEFGAFVDIGVGRDGLIHISELSVRRVGKVTDVLQEGQEIQAWIKKLDRERNRISLTLIDPDTKTIRDLEKGDIVKGRVTRLLPYGAFVDIGIGRDALLHVREMAEGFVAKPEDVVQVEEELEARIIDLSRRRSRVDLSLKGLRPEPEAAVPHHDQSQNSAPDAPEEVVEDVYENVEVLSAMELAFKRAMEAEGMEMPEGKRGKRGRRPTGRQIQDEIISRTLTDSGR